MARKNLVVMPIGRDSLISPWITQDKGRCFDVVLLSYHSIDTLKIKPSSTVKIYEFLDFKWWMIQHFFERHSAFLESYESFFFPDDDIEVSTRQINSLFNVFNHLSIKLAQPSLTLDSFMSWKDLRHKSFSGIRYMTSVELMCPMMKKDTLQYLLPTFKLTKSGWGVDLLWGKLVHDKYGQRKIVVIDAVQVRHGRPVGKGELYTKLNQTAQEEENAVREKYDLKENRIAEIKCLENRFLHRFFSRIVTMMWIR